ncbi:zinc-binding dehydrogenase [Arthrobacter sp. NPDC058097]|uniref:zinc-binding dehydrogenase n=1 Tax=Arthrobacter sp. NPDC058097 TaxID=3346340 RepID=UPI0036DAEC70
MVGGDGLQDSIRAAKGNGLVAVVGFLEGQTANLDLMDVIWHETQIQGIAVGRLRSFHDLVKFLDEHTIHPVVDSVYAFEDALAAYGKLSDGAFGKVVLSIP